MKKMSGWECPLSRTAAPKKSAAGEAGGGRTHTFGLRRPGAKLKIPGRLFADRPGFLQMSGHTLVLRK